MTERGQGWAGGPRVACLGECMVELRTRSDGLLSRSFGGDTLNTAVYLARLGVRTDYVSALGDDDFSADMVRAWEEEGVGTGHVLRLPGHLPGLYIIETDAAGERRFLHWRDSAPVRKIFDPPHADATEAALLASEVLYLSGITLSLFRDDALARLLATLERAREAGVRIVFDTNFRARAGPTARRPPSSTTASSGCATRSWRGSMTSARWRGQGRRRPSWPASNGREWPNRW